MKCENLSTKKSSTDTSTRAGRLREASQQRRTQEKQEVRQAILQAASELFLEHGYPGFSLRQVAEKIGYSPGTIYLYFQDKDEILFTIMGEGVARFSQMMLEVASISDIRERLRQMGQTYINFGLQYPAYYRLMFMQRTDYLLRSGTSEGVETTPQPLFAIFDLWRTTVEDAMKAGILRMGDPVSTGDAIWALLHGVVSVAILMPNFDAKRIKSMTESALELITTGLHK